LLTEGKFFQSSIINHQSSIINHQSRGIIDEVAIYDIPLTVKELQQDMEGVSASVELSGILATTWGFLKGFDTRFWRAQSKGK